MRACAYILNSIDMLHRESQIATNAIGADFDPFCDVLLRCTTADARDVFDHRNSVILPASGD